MEFIMLRSAADTIGQDVPNGETAPNSPFFAASS
jgi:hypothetical protein